MHGRRVGARYTLAVSLLLEVATSAVLAGRQRTPAPPPASTTYTAGDALLYWLGVKGTLETSTLPGADGEPFTLTYEVIEGLAIVGGDMIIGTAADLAEWAAADPPGIRIGGRNELSSGATRGINLRYPRLPPTIITKPRTGASFSRAASNVMFEGRFAGPEHQGVSVRHDAHLDGLPGPRECCVAEPIRQPPNDTTRWANAFDEERQRWYAEMELVGSALEPEDGPSSASALVWRTAQDAVQQPPLGTGIPLTVRTRTLRARDARSRAPPPTPVARP